MMVTSTLTPFDTTGAATDGPSDAPPCPAIGQDIWYRYTASCNGMLTVDLCQGTAFDAALAIYDGCTCPPTLLLGCDDNSCGGVAPSQSVSVVNGHCYLIRVGGVGSATGTGNVHVVCTPTTGTGACCKTDLSCEVLPPADCQIANGTFHGDGTICTPELCAPSLPPPACSGDVNGDCQVDDTDIPLFVQALLDPTLQSAEVCRADANGDGVLDGKDIQVFIDNVIAHCHCCHGDTNHDGKLDGLDIQGLINAVMAQSSPLAGCAYYYEPTADVNNDGIINVIDIDVFVNLLVNGGTCAP